MPALEQGTLPFYIRQAYKFHTIELINQPIILAVLNEGNKFTSTQIEKHLRLLQTNFKQRVAFVTVDITAINRRRLIDRRINFIVPGKQFYLPELLIDLKEDFAPKKKEKENGLLPSAQFILLYHILHRNERLQLAGLSFKEIASKLGYSSMTITKAVQDLKDHELCDVIMRKEHYLRFELERKNLWEKAQSFLINPVLRRLYVDKKPMLPLLASNLTALPEYSDMNPGGQEYYAIERSIFYRLEKESALINENHDEGAYCIEIWKYDPVKLADGISKYSNVDPLSLYLSLKGNPDERVEMALDQIIQKYIW